MRCSLLSRFWPVFRGLLDEVYPGMLVSVLSTEACQLRCSILSQFAARSIDMHLWEITAIILLSSDQ